MGFHIGWFCGRLLRLSGLLLRALWFLTLAAAVSLIVAALVAAVLVFLPIALAAFVVGCVAWVVYRSTAGGAL